MSDHERDENSPGKDVPPIALEFETLYSKSPSNSKIKLQGTNQEPELDSTVPVVSNTPPLSIPPKPPTDPNSVTSDLPSTSKSTKNQSLYNSVPESQTKKGDVYEFSSLKSISESWKSKPNTTTLLYSKFNLQEVPLISSRKKDSKGDLITVINCTLKTSKTELSRFRLLKTEHLFVTELFNAGFNDIIPSPLQLQSITLASNVSSDFIKSIFQQCINLKSFKILGEIEGNLLKPKSMSSIIEKTFPSLKKLSLDIGSDYKKQHYLKYDVELTKYSKWTRDSMALVKSTATWAPILDHLKIDTFITQQWNWYQMSLRLLRFFTAHSKSLKQLDITLSLPPPLINSTSSGTDPDFNTELVRLKPDEKQYLKTTLRTLTRKNKFQRLQHITLDVSIDCDKEIWLMLLQAQRFLESLAVKLTFTCNEISSLIFRNFITLKTLEVTCDMSPELDFEIIARCSALHTIYLQHYSPEVKTVRLVGLDVGRGRMPHLECLTLMGFKFHRSDVTNLTCEDICGNVRLKALGILGEGTTPDKVDGVGGRINFNGSSTEVGSTGQNEFEKWVKNMNPDYGFTWDELKNLLSIRSLEYFIFDPAQLSCTCVFQMASICNLIGSFADKGPGGIFKICV